MPRDSGSPITRPAVWLVAGGPLGLATVRGIAHATGATMAPWQLATALGGAATMSAAGVAALRSPRIAGAATGLGATALVASLAPTLVERPALTLAALLFLIGTTARLWTRRLHIERLERSALVDLRLSAAIALVTWLIAAVASGVRDPYVAVASALASAVAVAHALAWTRSTLGKRWWRLWAVSIAIAIAIAVTAAATQRIALALTILAAVPAATLFVARARGVQVLDTGWTSLVLHHPARLVVATFLVLCALGAMLLVLPPVEAPGVDISALDAAFTAVSAVCVTGLIVVDTARDFSAVGQLSILVLIQLGALGIMSLSTAAFALIGRRLSVRHEVAVAGALGGDSRGQLFTAVKRTLAVTFAVEAAGAVILALLFLHAGDDAGPAAWRGVFTAVSAFCNAGFALQTDSLMPYQHAPAILHTVALLIVAGGVSPVVIVALPRLLRRRPMSLQIKLVLLASGALLVAGFIAYTALEWDHSLASLSGADRFHNAWFQSVTFRTAGFNSVDMAELRPATLPLACILMFIGGAPGGTAGGVKVTTASVILLGVAAALRGQGSATVFNRRIPHRVVYDALAIVALGAAVTGLLFVALLLTQTLAGDAAVFEIVSASGTVGLSMGGTAQLDELGKVIIMVAMFLGRVGPLTAFLFLAERATDTAPTLIEESVEVG